MLGKKGDRSGSGLALVILVAPSPETALVGGKQGQEAGQEHSEWVELCPGTRGSQECLLWQCNVSPLTPWVTCDVVTLWSHCPHRQGLTRGITDNNIQTVYRESGYRKGRIGYETETFLLKCPMKFVSSIKYQGPRCESWEILQWDRYLTKRPEPEKYIIKYTTIKWKEKETVSSKISTYSLGEWIKALNAWSKIIFNSYNQAKQACIISSVAIEIHIDLRQTRYLQPVDPTSSVLMMFVLFLISRYFVGDVWGKGGYNWYRDSWGWWMILAILTSHTFSSWPPQLCSQAAQMTEVCIFCPKSLSSAVISLRSDLTQSGQIETTASSGQRVLMTSNYWSQELESAATAE